MLEKGNKMLPFRNILSPTDFSEPSYKAIRAAGELALHFSARLCILHVVSLAPLLSSPELPANFDVQGYQRQLEDEAMKQLDEVVRRLVPQGLENLEQLVRSGYYADKIFETAREKGSDLIVIGTRGRTGLPHLILGSVAERVVQLASCPVLTIGQAAAVKQ